MKLGTIEILDLDFEYKLWKNKLKYFGNEIELLQDRAYVLSKEQPGWVFSIKSVLLLEIQLKAIKSIHTHIKVQEHEIALYAEDYPIDDCHSQYVIHEGIRKEVGKISFRQSEIIGNIYPELCFPIKRD